MGSAWYLHKFSALVCVTWSTMWWVTLLLSLMTSLPCPWQICSTAGLTARAPETLAATTTEHLTQLDPGLSGRASPKRFVRNAPWSAAVSRHGFLRDQPPSDAYRGQISEFSASGKDHTVVPDQLTSPEDTLTSFLGANSTAAAEPPASTTGGPYLAPRPLETWLPQPTPPAGPLSDLPLPHLPELPVISYVNTTAMQSPIATRIANALPFVNVLPPPPLAPLPTSVVSNAPPAPASPEPVVAPAASSSVPQQQTLAFQPSIALPLATATTPQSASVTQPSLNQPLSPSVVPASGAMPGIVAQASSTVPISPVIPLNVPVSSESQVQGTIATPSDGGPQHVAPESQPEETEVKEGHDVSISDAGMPSEGDENAGSGVTQLGAAEELLQSPNNVCFDRCTCIPVVIGGVSVLVISGVSVLAATILMSQLFSKGFFSKNFFRHGGWVILLASGVGLVAGGLLGGLVNQCWTSALYAGGGFMSFAVSSVLVGTRGAWIGGFGGSIAGATIAGLASATPVAVTLGLVFGLLAGIVIGFAPILTGVEMNVRYIRWRTRAQLASSRSHTDDHRRGTFGFSPAADGSRGPSETTGAPGSGTTLSLGGGSTRRLRSGSVTSEEAIDPFGDDREIVASRL